MSIKVDNVDIGDAQEVNNFLNGLGLDENQGGYAVLEEQSLLFHSETLVKSTKTLPKVANPVSAKIPVSPQQQSKFPSYPAVPNPIARVSPSPLVPTETEEQQSFDDSINRVVDAVANPLDVIIESNEEGQSHLTEKSSQGLSQPKMKRKASSTSCESQELTEEEMEKRR